MTETQVRTRRFWWKKKRFIVVDIIQKAKAESDNLAIASNLVNVGKRRRNR